MTDVFPWAYPPMGKLVIGFYKLAVASFPSNRYQFCDEETGVGIGSVIIVGF
jgi:hypothetical protein